MFDATVVLQDLFLLGLGETCVQEGPYGIVHDVGFELIFASAHKFRKQGHILFRKPDRDPFSLVHGHTEKKPQGKNPCEG